MSCDQSFSSEQVRALFADELPIVGVGAAYLPSVPTTGVPVLIVDAVGRLDVADLGRVLRLEPQGSTTGFMRLVPFFRRPKGYVAVTISFTSTVNCSLKLIFRLPRQSRLAQNVVAAPKFAISPDPIDAAGNFDPSKVIVLTLSGPNRRGSPGGCPGRELGAIGSHAI